MRNRHALASLALVLLLAGCSSLPPPAAPPSTTTTTHAGDIGTSRPGEDHGDDLGGRQSFDVRAFHYVGTPSSIRHPRPTDQAGTAGAPGTPLGEGDDPPAVMSVDCTLGALKVLDAAQTVAYLDEHEQDCLYFLWSWHPDLAQVYTQAKLLAVIDNATTDADAWDGTNSAHLLEKVFFVRLAYFHHFYHPGALPIPVIVNATAMDVGEALANNTHLLDPTEDAAQILNQWLNMLDAGYLGHGFVDQLVDVLGAYRNDTARQALYHWQSSAFTVGFLVQRGASQSPDFQAAVSGDLVAALSDYATWNTTRDQYFAVNNMLWALGQVVKHVPAHKAAALEALTDAYHQQPTLSQPYLWAINAIDRQNACQTSVPNETVCRSDVVPAILAAAFPRLHTLDEGTIRVHTPLNLSAFLPLYYAIRQVEAQFHRITETLLPIPSDPNGVLTIRLYGSRVAYEDWHWFLYDLPTNNGGIYIEQTGTFFTYDRTKAESIYSLDELTRHEYGHYLVARYLIAGFWGEVPIYHNQRMVWFDEGLAEFLTWSTEADGVKARRLLVEQVIADEANGWARMTVPEVLSSTYGDFRFYRYSGLFFNYLYEHQREDLQALLRHTHESNATAFDAWVQGHKADAALQQTYEDYVDALIADVEDLTDPATGSPGPGAPAEDAVADIQAAFRTSRIGYLGDCRLATGDNQPRFSCRGYVTGTTGAADHGAEWATFDAALDELWNELAEDPDAPDNFDWMVCRFGLIRRVGDGAAGHAIADYHCDGPLKAANQQAPLPLQRMKDDIHATRLGANAACGYAAGSVQCNLNLSTGLRVNTTPDAVFDRDMADALAELANQIYAASPSFYRDLACNLTGAVQEVAFGANQEYRVAPARCTIPPQPVVVP